MRQSPSNYASCPSHCCIAHGCKYSYEECPVATGKVRQEFPCEDCGERGIPERAECQCCGAVELVASVAFVGKVVGVVCLDAEECQRRAVVKRAEAMTDLIEARRERDEARAALRLRDTIIGGLLGFHEGDMERVDAACDALGADGRVELLELAQREIGGGR